MVVFVCSSCNLSLRINQVTVHSCNAKFSCFSCSEEFSKLTVKSHTQCISEAEKYKGIDFNVSKNENRNIEKRNNWCNAINEFFTSFQTADSELQKVIDSIKNQSNIPDKEKPFTYFVKNKIGFAMTSNILSKHTKSIWILISPLKEALNKPIPVTKERQFNVEGQKRKHENKTDQEESDTKIIKIDSEIAQIETKPTKSDKKKQVKNNDKIETNEPKEKKSKRNLKVEIPVNDINVENEKQTKSKTKKNKKPEIVEEIKTKTKAKKTDKETYDKEPNKNEKKDENKQDKEVNELKEKKSKAKKSKKEIVLENIEKENKIEEKQTKINSKKINETEIVEEKIEEKENKKKSKKGDQNKEEILELVTKPKEKKSKNTKNVKQPDPVGNEIMIDDKQSKSTTKKNKKREEKVEEEIATEIEKDDKKKPETNGIVPNVAETKIKSKSKKKDKKFKEASIDKMEVDEIIPTEDDKPEPTANIINDGINNKENVAIGKKPKSKKNIKVDIIETKMEVDELTKETPKKQRKNKKKEAIATEESGEKSSEINDKILMEKAQKKKGTKINIDNNPIQVVKDNNVTEKQKRKRKLN